MAGQRGPANRDARLEACQQAIGYRFDDLELLDRCLTHASVAPIRLESNERLEFLGDAILGAIVCERLFERYPESPEGELTRIKSIVVSGSSCAEMSEQIGLERFLRIGKGLAGGRGVPQSIFAAAFESMVAGIFLDGGLEPARRFVLSCIAEGIDEAADAGLARNFKHQLQQVAQKRLGETPTYRLVDEQGPDHAKCFQVAAVLADHIYPAAWGPNKKEAEQEAARNALVELGETVAAL